jgi:SAM-dependent methyltransferase
VKPDESRLFHRSDIYTSGPSVSEINPTCLELVDRYLRPPNGRILDVGCGFGGYGRALIAAGYDWFGVEVKESDCAELTRLGLPHQRVDGGPLPFADAAFDSAICIEVLEHIAAPEPFLAEIRRVTRRRALFSVPNLELIPYLHRYAVVPWHLLEGDHKNFFARPSLRALLSGFFRNVEVLSYAEIPLRTPDDLPLHNHLFAICEV